MREPGEIRRRDDGTFEYLRSVSMSLRYGLVEQWDSAAEHAAKNMLMPAPFLENLRAHGYQGGGSLFDLLIAEGWKRPQRDYVQVDPVTGGQLGRPLIDVLGELEEKTPVISIVVCSFGAEHWRELALVRAGPSAEAQADDVVMVHAEQGPIEAVRNVAVTAAEGEWICFLDADDELADGFVDAMTDAIFDQPDRLALLAPHVQYVRKGVAAPPLLPGARHPMPPINHCVVSTVLSRQLFESAGGFDESFWPWSDYELWLRCARHGARVFEVPNAVVRVHVNPGSDNQTLDARARAELGGRILNEHVARGGELPIAGGEARGPAR